jgi:hypothetical protein
MGIGLKLLVVAMVVGSGLLVDRPVAYWFGLVVITFIVLLK